MPTTIDLAAMTPAQGIAIAGTGSVVSLASAGDVNGDGFEDIVFGVPSADGGNGRAYVVFGAASGSGNLDLANLGDRGFTIFGWETSRGPAMAGASVSGGGDINGDGFDDVVIGAPGESWYDPGWAFVIYGDDSDLGPVNLAALASMPASSSKDARAFRTNGMSGTTWAGACRLSAMSTATVSATCWPDS